MMFLYIIFVVGLISLHMCLTAFSWDSINGGFTWLMVGVVCFLITMVGGTTTRYPVSIEKHYTSEELLITADNFYTKKIQFVGDIDKWKDVSSAFLVESTNIFGMKDYHISID